MRKYLNTPRISSEKKKDTKHSSKNEGQHTDRRYLCYLCHKLFTRRRSVRDHLVKIHGEKTWEPTKSLEIEVEPHTGEPIEPIADLIARGPVPITDAEQRDDAQEILGLMIARHLRHDAPGIDTTMGRV